MSYQLSAVSQNIVRSEIRELLKLSRKPGVISFGGGLPDASLFPTREIAEITGEVLQEKGYLALQYGPIGVDPGTKMPGTWHLKRESDDESG